MKIVAADSGAAILDEEFRPLFVVAAAAILVDSPYRRASFSSAEPIFSKVEEGPLLVIHELEMCASLLKEIGADVVHLDMSLGGLNLEGLSAIQLSKMRISGRARRHILRILPNIRKIASDISRVHGIEVLAMGKDSIPVRIAELTSGANAVLYAAERAVEQDGKLRLGLPSRCRMSAFSDGVELHSLEPAEYDVAGSANDEKSIVKSVVFSEISNPRARGFRAIEITPKA